MFGAFSTPTIIRSAEFPKFGFKLWPGEVASPSNKWYTLMEAAIESKTIKEKEDDTDDSAPKGKYVSIWGE